MSAALGKEEMFKHHQLKITHRENVIELSWRRGEEAERDAPETVFEHPFDEQVQDELRWYLEDYLRFPYGLEPDRAEKIERQFREWGQRLFALVFDSSQEARTFFQEATRAGLDGCELAISSDDPKVLNLPWELIYSPIHRAYLAPLLAGVYRTLSSHPVRAEVGEMPQDQLNILLVIARPYGKQDVSLRTIARPMIEALEPIRKQVNLKVLRPPSFEQLERELNAHKGYYHIVHFDGHGGFDPSSRDQQYAFGGEGQGVLVFEKADGSAEEIPAHRIAQNLADCRVPIFILNACQSGQVGKDPFSSVAMRLVSLGAKGVVAMAYSVYVEAAKHLVGRLYEQLVLGSSLSSALSAGRREMLNAPERPSPKGFLPLQDWMVPVLYQQEAYTPFPKQVQPTSLIEMMQSAKELKAQPEATPSIPMALPSEGTYGFVGRDYEILRLERAFRQNQVVLLEGMGGTGKTELAKGFARWLRDTKGREGGIFFTSFEQGATLNNVVNQIGRVLVGENFAQYNLAEQRAAVLQYLQTKPCLLIWDNFEPVAGFPRGNSPLLTEEAREELKQWLKEMHSQQGKGQSWVLITSRREEPWLDCGYCLEHLRGLSPPDAEELAAKILLSVGVEPKNLPAEYLELLQILGGHPLSLRVVLPHLKTKKPLKLIEALRQGLDTFKGEKKEDRAKSLTVSLDYSFRELSDRARQHLPFLGLFSELVDADWLHQFSSTPDSEFGQAYRAMFGENLEKSDWLALLDEAAEAGILDHLGETYYKIHPALPWYLRQRLSEAQRIPQMDDLEKKLLDFYAGLADYYGQELISNAEVATTILLNEESNLLQYLRLAEQQQNWANAQYILSALGAIYERSVRQPEFRALRQRGLNKVGIHLAEAKVKGLDGFSFWMYLRGMDANEALRAADLKTARAIYQKILDELTALNDSSMERNIAVSYHQLGMVAQEQRQWQEAIAYYQKALKIREDAGDFYKAANDYHQLGMVAFEQRQWQEAIAYYQKALKIREDAGDFYNAATDYHELGYVAQEQRQWQEAVAYYQKALKIREDAGDFYNAATDYHQLGMVAQEQGQWQEAVAYYQKALKIFEDAGDFYKAAGDYHQLGNVTFEQGQWQEAIPYYQKALKIYEDAGDFYNAAYEYHNLGMVAFEQRQWQEAIPYYQKALKIYEDAGDFYKAAGDYHQLGIVAQEQRQWQEAIPYYQKALKIYEDAGDFYKAAGDYHQLGMVAFEQRQWQEAIPYYQKALKIYEDAGDFYNAADEYHQLGLVAQEQQQWEEAIAYYQKSLKLFEQFEDWSQVSVCLSHWGSLLEAQLDWSGAARVYIQALTIDLEENEDWASNDVQDLGRTFKMLGESEFKKTWCQVTEEDCPPDWLSLIRETSEKSEESDASSIDS